MTRVHPISRRSKLTLAMLWLGLAGSLAAQSAKPGILLLAHGGGASWNDSVLEIARGAGEKYPVEVAFGMATRANIQKGIDQLAARGVTQVIAVPLFVSQHSSVVQSTEYLLRLRTDMPEDLKLFVTMSHGPGASHATHAPDEHGTHPVQSNLSIRMTPALGRHRSSPTFC